LQDALRKEVALLTSLNHPNLVRFCGVCLDPPLVVMEYYRHGNVYSMLEKARRQWSKRSATTQHIRQASKVRTDTVVCVTVCMEAVANCI
jgi:serine/threonine protein kinase